MQIIQHVFLFADEIIFKSFVDISWFKFAIF